MGSCKWFQVSKILVVFSAAFLSSEAVQSQELDEGIGLSVRVNGSWMMFENQHVSAFNYAPSGTVGAHFGISKNYGKWEWERELGSKECRLISRAVNCLFRMLEKR